MLSTKEYIYIGEVVTLAYLIALLLSHFLNRLLNKLVAYIVKPLTTERGSK